MRKFVYILLFLAISGYSLAQKLTPQWELNSGGDNYDAATAITFDGKGDMYATGYFQNEATFGSKKLKSNGDTDIYLAKYGKHGKLHWVVTAGSDYSRPNLISEFGSSIVCDKKDNVYFLGSFKRTAFFEKESITSYGSDDIFIAKYSKDGSLIWVRNAGGKSQDRIMDAAVDDDGNLYLTGFYQNEAKFNQVTLQNNAHTNFFIAKYSADGDVVWVQNLTQTGQANGSAIAFYNNSLYVAGNFEGRLADKNKEILSEGNQNIFISKYSVNGDCELLKNIGEQVKEQVNGIDVNKGGIFITGWTENFYNQLKLRNTFIAQLSLLGDDMWYRKINTGANNEGKSIKVVRNNQIIVAGYF